MIEYTPESYRPIGHGQNERGIDLRSESKTVKKLYSDWFSKYKYHVINQSDMLLEMQ